MAMLPDLLKSLVESLHPEGGPPHSDGSDVHRLPPEVIDNNQSTGREWTPKQLMQQNDNSFPNTVTGDNGIASINQSNPFLDAITKSRANNNSGPSVLRQMLSSVLGGGLVPGTGTIGGDPAGVSGPTHTPGTKQDAALNPTPMKGQSQFNLQPTVPLPQPRPDYSQPTALDPTAIEQLRQSLLSDSGQRDPNNPNGLAGRMSGPNSQVDQNNQRQEAMSIEDSVRGFDQSARINVGPKQNKGGIGSAYPNTDDNMFFANGRDEKIIRAKRELRDKMLKGNQ